MKRASLILMFLTWTMLGFATHNRAGEILFERVNDSNPFLYQITIVTYTKYDFNSSTQANEADRCQLDIDFGDGTAAIVRRSNGQIDNDVCEDGIPIGVEVPQSNNIKRNEYTINHEFPGPGTYEVTMVDPNRNANILNIPNSVQVPFSISSSITIDQVSGGNNAPLLRNPPIDNGCVGSRFEHNPGAVDPDGDSLVYRLIACSGANGQTIGGYSFPNNVVGNEGSTLTLDSRTGDLVWDAPQVRGEYNVCIEITEFRRNPANGNIIKVGRIIRDMQITIGTCDKTPPNLSVPNNVCVTAGQTITETITATDDGNNRLVLSANGFPFEAENRATMNGNGIPAGGFEIEGFPPIDAVFSWSTRCDNIQLQPYFVYFKAKQEDNLSVELVDFETMELQVVAPPVVITNVQPQGKTMRVEWAPSNCTQANGYEIYRYTDSLGYVPRECVTGVPDGLGYVLIGETEGLNATTFVDDGDGLGLVHGQQYCYMIVTLYPDGSISYPSVESCSELIRDVPILNKVSVIETDSIDGTDSISWYEPTDLRTDIYGPPYKYELSRSTAVGGTYEVVYTSVEANDISLLETSFFDRGLNTVTEQYYYNIRLLSGGEETGLSRAAASIYLTAQPDDNQLTLSWSVDVPWTNTEYVVFRFDDPDLLDTFKVLDTVTGTTYVDDSLANEQPYAYFIQATGGYSSADLPDILINNSQIIIAEPKDLTPPCPPQTPKIIGDCDLEENSLEWGNPNVICPETDDVLQFKIYYAPILGQPLEVIETITSADVTEFSHSREGSIAGCYAITAIDSFDNESEFSQSLCVDNCPVYELPNVFTPGSDGFNDEFEPYPYKFVEDISLVIFNRWGARVFETTDPDINWNGTNQANGERLPDGVYFYDCTVNEIRLTGIVPRNIRGAIHILSEKGSATPAN